MNLDDYYYQHLTPRTLENKEKLLDVSKDIEHSFTGRLDVMGLHISFLEASSLLRNAVRQYEQGFFDSAFYSVRSALELARVIAYFSDQDQPVESDIYKKWVQGEKFPYDSQVKTLLNDTSTVYGEVREALQGFFDGQDERLKRIQKYIHKQGYNTFYNQNAFRPDLREFRTHKVDELFSEFLTNSTIEIAILRLCIDPFPILLRDENVMYKIHFQPVTEPYGTSTVELIGQANVKRYCGTEFYKSMAESFNTNEELEEPTHTLINDQFYDRTKWGVIKKQLHLLSNDDVLAVRIFNLSKDITKIYLHNGWHWYFSDTKSLQLKMGFDSRELLNIKEAKSNINVGFEEVFRSYFSNGESECWIEHNKRFQKHQINKIKEVLQEKENKTKGIL